MDFGGAWVCFFLSLPKINPLIWGENIGENTGIKTKENLIDKTCYFKQNITRQENVTYIKQKRLQNLHFSSLTFSSKIHKQIPPKTMTKLHQSMIYLDNFIYYHLFG